MSGSDGLWTNIETGIAIGVRSKKGFLVQGSDKVGAVSRHIQKLGDRKINVTAADAITAGSGRYGMILWVKPKDYARATRALGAR